MAQKFFINQCSFDLNVELTVRAGDEVGTASDVMQFKAPAGFNSSVTYGDDNNPYLDGIIASNVEGDGSDTGSVYVYDKEDSGDNALNTNNTVTFGWQNAITITCTNS